MADIFDNLDIFDQIDSKPSLTGDPRIDMAGPNAAVEEARSRILPEGIGSVPGTLAKSAGNIVGGVAQAVTHPADTAMGILKAASHPVDALSGYIKGRYDTGENIARTMVTDPFGVIIDASLVGGLMSAGTKAGVRAIDLNKATPEQLIGKAENITQRILNPSKDVIADAIIRKSQVPAVREAAKVIKKSKTYEQAIQSIDDAVAKNFSERKAIYESNNFKMTDNYIKQAEAALQQRRAQGQLTAAELNQKLRVIADEKAWYVANKDKFDRMGAQARKEFLQKQSEPLLKAERAGQNTEISRFRMQALDDLRSGLMKEVTGNDPRVTNLNSTYEGLKSAKEMLAEEAAVYKQNINKGLVDKVGTLLSGIANPKSAAINTIMWNASRLSKTSGQVEKLMAEATKGRVKSVIDEAIKSEKILGLPNLTPKYIQDRINKSPGSLGVKTGPMKNRPFQIGGVGDKNIIDSN